VTLTQPRPRRGAAVADFSACALGPRPSTSPAEYGPAAPSRCDCPSRLDEGCQWMDADEGARRATVDACALLSDSFASESLPTLGHYDRRAPIRRLALAYVPVERRSGSLEHLIHIEMLSVTCSTAQSSSRSFSKVTVTARPGHGIKLHPTRAFTCPTLTSFTVACCSRALRGSDALRGVNGNYARRAHVSTMAADDLRGATARAALSRVPRPH
jgi:hypothetical protein